MKRRSWLLTGLGAAGALVVGWGALPPRWRLGSADLMALKSEIEGQAASGAGTIAFNGWLALTPGGDVILAMPRSEMGQGVHTALPMLVADELGVPLERIRLQTAGHDAIYGNVALALNTLPFHPSDASPEPQLKVRMAHWVVAKVGRELGLIVTGGSTSVADAWDVLRLAAATVREALRLAAAQAWGVPAREVVLAGGQLSHPGGKTAALPQFAAAAAQMRPDTVVLKPREQWTLIGRAVPRRDVPAKVNGSATYGLDVRPPGLLYAAVRHCPMLGGGIATLDEAALRSQPGVKAVVRLPEVGGSTEGFAVVATSWWLAQQAALAANVSWREPVGGKLETAQVARQLQARVQQDDFENDAHSFHSRGDVENAFSAAPQKALHDARYTAPYLAHAAMEPINATARVQDGQVELWAPTQVPGFARDIAARVAGVEPAAVRLHVTQLGGGFGRRLEAEHVGQAVHVARAVPGSPVQLIWSREEDTTHDVYRPMNAARLTATLDDQGRIAALRIRSAGDAISPRWLARNAPRLSAPFDTPDRSTAEGLFDLPYGIAHQHMAHAATRMGVPVGFWRSVGHSHNAFFSESFIDELAHAAKQDPVAFRRLHLTHTPRHLAVLNLAAERAGWGQPLPAGRARGVALHESFGSVVAMVAEVSKGGEGPAARPRVHRVVVAVDCGTVVNPGIVAQQMEGSVVFALTAALHGRIDVVGGAVQQTSFPSYPLLGLADCPVVETHTVPSTAAPAGVGEPGVPPVAPAVANAWFALTGVRVRQLPIVAD